MNLDVKLETLIADAFRKPSEKQRPKLWRVRVDGRHAGFLPWKKGSRLLMHLRFAPEEMLFIESEVARQRAIMTSEEETEVKSVMPSELPNEKLTPEEDGIDADDFD